MCDCLCALPAAAADAATLFAKNSDRPPTEAQAIERHPPRRETETRTTYLTIDPAPSGDTIGFVGSRPVWQWGMEHGVNDAGVAIGNETVYTVDDPRLFAPGLIGMDLVRLALERAATVADAVAVVTGLIERHGQGGSGHEIGHRPYWSSFLVADPNDAFVVETSGQVVAVEPVERTRAISNRLTIPAFDAAYRHPRQPVDTLVDPRWRASNAVLSYEPVSVTALKAHLRSHVGGDGGWTVCMHVPGVEATTASLVAELRVGSPPVARFLLGSPCLSVFVPIVVGAPLGQPPAWERFAALRPGHRAALDDLEQHLEDKLAAEFGAAAADVSSDWNHYVWMTVVAVLGGLV